MTGHGVRVARSGPVTTVFLDRPATAALASEFTHGRAALEREAGAGAARFASGAGRHGTF